MGVNIKKLLELNRSHVKIKDIKDLERKIAKLVSDGKEKLQVVADFDCTLTKQRVDNGNKLMSSFGMFSECPSIPEHYKVQDRQLCDVYKPIEVDPTISIAVKTDHMCDWYKEGCAIMRGLKFPYDELEFVSKKVGENLRDGVCDMFSSLDAVNVPVLVFSAGLGDAVVSVLKSSNILTNNVKVISNFLKIGEDGIIEGMQGEVIHVFNKNETVIKDTEYYELIRNRGNVILLGDSLGDATMADGIEHSEAVIKIAYLYHNVEGNLPQYLEKFDIVLVDDQTVDIPRALLNLLL